MNKFPIQGGSKLSDVYADSNAHPIRATLYKSDVAASNHSSWTVSNVNTSQNVQVKVDIEYSLICGGYRSKW
jgi:hypothetical protein